MEAADPHVAVFMPCGYTFDQAVDEGRRLLDVPALARAEHIYATDANALFSRPGPRLVDGLEALAWALHPRRLPVRRRPGLDRRAPLERTATQVRRRPHRMPVAKMMITAIPSTTR